MLDNKEIGLRIKKSRNEKDMSVIELADKLSVSEKTVYKWESAIGIPGTEFFPKFAKIFEKPIEYFMPEIEEVKEEVEEEPEKVETDVAAEVEKYKPLCVQHGILILDELIKIKNINVIKEFLVSYPITYCEILCGMAEKKQYKELYRFAVDYGVESLAAVVIKGDGEKIRFQIARHFSVHNDSEGYDNFNEAWLRSRLNSLPESVAYEKPTDYYDLKQLQQINAKYFVTYWMIGSTEELTKRHLLEVLSGMEEYNG